MKTWDQTQSKKRNRNADHKNHYAMDILDSGRGILGQGLLTCGVHTRIQKRILTHGNKGILRMQVNEPARAALLDYRTL
jgi:hypothetical protein